MYKLFNFYSLISDPSGILLKSSETFGPAGNRHFYDFIISVYQKHESSLTLTEYVLKGFRQTSFQTWGSSI
jgi:hypothetical protein